MQNKREMLRFLGALVLVLGLYAFSGEVNPLPTTDAYCTASDANHACVTQGSPGTLTPGYSCGAGSCSTCVHTSVRCAPFRSGINRDDWWQESP